MTNRPTLLKRGQDTDAWWARWFFFFHLRYNRPAITDWWNDAGTNGEDSDWLITTRGWALSYLFSKYGQENVEYVYSPTPALTTRELHQGFYPTTCVSTTYTRPGLIQATTTPTDSPDVCASEETPEGAWCNGACLCWKGNVSEHSAYAFDDEEEAVWLRRFPINPEDENR